MSKTWKLQRAATREIQDAAHWLDGEREGLGAALLADVRARLADVRALPGRMSRMPGAPPDRLVYRARLARFPYVLVVLELEEEFRVIALVHDRRAPGYWLSRLED